MVFFFNHIYYISLQVGFWIELRFFFSIRYAYKVFEKSGIWAKLTILPFFLDTLTSLWFGSCSAGLCLWYQESELAASFLRGPSLGSHTCGYTPYPESHLHIATLDPQFRMGHGSIHSGCGSLWVGPVFCDCSRDLFQVPTQSLHFQAFQGLTNSSSLEINPYQIYRE